MLEIAICDGNARDSGTVKALLEQYRLARPGLMFQIGIYDCAADLLETEGAQIYILDVVLPGGDGLETAALLRERNPGSQVVFLTASRRHAIEAYRVRALQYLLKPVVQEELFSALDEAVALMGRQLETRFQVKTAQGIRWLPMSQIVYLRPNQHVVELFLQDGSQVCTQNLRVSFSQFISPLLESCYFVRPHHSYVVNKAYIDHLTPDALILRDETAIPVSHSKYRSMKALFL